VSHPGLAQRRAFMARRYRRPPFRWWILLLSLLSLLAVTRSSCLTRVSLH